MTYKPIISFLYVFTKKDSAFQDKHREVVSIIACYHRFARPKLDWQVAVVSREFTVITWAFHGHGEGYEEVGEPNALGPVGVEDSENVLNNQSCRTPGDTRVHGGGQARSTLLFINLRELRWQTEVKKSEISVETKKKQGLTPMANP